MNIMDRFRAKVSQERIAHKPVGDDPNDTRLFHCAFCGSGRIFARSDDSIECEQCSRIFTVELQANHPFMPGEQAGPGIPLPTEEEGGAGEVQSPLDQDFEEEFGPAEGELPGGEEEGDEESGGFPFDKGDGDEDDEDDEPKGMPQRFTTSEGLRLSEASYVRYLRRQYDEGTP